MFADRFENFWSRVEEALTLAQVVVPSKEVHRLDMRTIALVFTVLLALAIATTVGWFLRRQPDSSINPAILRKFNLRVRAWWMMCAILSLGLLLGPAATVVLFGLVSFWALREFITMTPTRRGDHRTLFWVFFVFTPLQYLFVGLGRELYGLYSIMIPVYGALFIPARIAVSGDYRRFLERSAKIQAGLLICVYALSHAPALLDLPLLTWKTDVPRVTNESQPRDSEPGSNLETLDEGGNLVGQRRVEVKKRLWTEGSNAGLLFYFVLIVQLGDVFQYAWGQFLGRRVIAPDINVSRTWEGFFGGVATTTLIGGLLWWATPFRLWEAACFSLVIAVMGFAGGMTMSAIKRDRGVTDYGTLVQGHAGVLDRIDSICFAAPVFFHLTRYYFSEQVF